MTPPITARILFLAMVAIASSPCQAPPDQAELRALRDKKLTKPVFVNGGWISDYEQARTRAKVGNRPIVAYFTRSNVP